VVVNYNTPTKAAGNDFCRVNNALHGCSAVDVNQREPSKLKTFHITSQFLLGDNEIAQEELFHCQVNRMVILTGVTML